jgi:hypothetical protein
VRAAASAVAGVLERVAGVWVRLQSRAGFEGKADPPALRKDDNIHAKTKNNTRTARGWESGGSGSGEAEAELGGGFAMAEETEGAEIVEVALAAAFGYGADVVGVP